MIRISDMIIELHNLARKITVVDFEEGMKVRMLADDLAKIGNKLHEKEIDNARN